MADPKDLSKLQQIASSGAPIKEAHANKKRDKDGNEIRLEELANFNPEIFLENHRSFLKKLKIISLVLMITSAVLLVFAITLCITFLILGDSQRKRIEELQEASKSGEWKISSCQVCYKLSDNTPQNYVAANMSRTMGTNLKEMETAPCEYSISNFWKCEGLENGIPDSNSFYYCLKNLYV
uniref:Uncharacterized protein n=1 Tax=Panagrolaimus sp. ES5 TaxID=591445 RepID=A0AC34G6C3_9BILA